MSRFFRSPWPIATLLLLLGGAWLLWHGMQNKVGRDVTLAKCPIAERLPPAASHVSYVVGSPATICEFDVPESDFLSWAKTNGWNVEPITPDSQGEPWSINRFGHGSGDSRDPQKIEIERGYRFEWKSTVDEQRLVIAYDLDHRRGYYYRSFR